MTRRPPFHSRASSDDSSWYGKSMRASTEMAGLSHACDSSQTTLTLTQPAHQIKGQSSKAKPG
eukprot:1158590-Pelagomonas_calceolata.AAC.4